jgi:hypothetical protein
MGDYLPDIEDITDICLDRLQNRVDQMIEVLDPKSQSGIKILLEATYLPDNDDVSYLCYQIGTTYERVVLLRDALKRIMDDIYLHNESTESDARRLVATPK